MVVPYIFDIGTKLPQYIFTTKIIVFHNNNMTQNEWVMFVHSVLVFVVDFVTPGCPAYCEIRTFSSHWNIGQDTVLQRSKDIQK